MASSNTVNQQLAALEGLVAREPNGITIADISNRGVVELDRRTLQRRLAALVAAGRITSAGSSRATLYLPGSMARGENVVLPSPIQPSLFAVRSPAAEDVRSLITRPKSARKPVSYNRKFLESYRPNVSAYLSAAQKIRLHEIGRTSMTDQPLVGTHAQGILNRLLIDLSWNSSRLEGNTYSLLDTARLIEAGEAAEGRPATDRQMILNHKAAIEFLVQSAEDIGFNRYTILNLHALLAENLLQDPSAAGRLRTIAVGISQSKYVPASVPQVIDECFAQVLASAEAIIDPFEQAFFVMVHLP